MTTHLKSRWTQAWAYMPKVPPVRPTTCERIIIERRQKRVALYGIAVAVFAFVWMVGHLVWAVMS